ncbi:chalcone isomerase family protein [bacterium]|nr:chalcone isomerase family protein [bacterium]
MNKIVHHFPFPACLFFLLALPLVVCGEGQLFPDVIHRAGKQLVLNGIGMRTATWFRVKVYRAGLYREEKSQDPEEILTSGSHVFLKLSFLRSVGKEKLQDAWSEGLKESSPRSAELLAPLEQLNGYMEDVSEGSELSIDFLFGAGRVEVELSGKKPLIIEAAHFPQALLGIWLGKSPPNEELKEGLLGRSEM